MHTDCIGIQKRALAADDNVERQFRAAQFDSLGWRHRFQIQNVDVRNRVLVVVAALHGLEKRLSARSSQEEVSSSRDVPFKETGVIPPLLRIQPHRRRREEEERHQQGEVVPEGMVHEKGVQLVPEALVLGKEDERHQVLGRSDGDFPWTGEGVVSIQVEASDVFRESSDCQVVRIQLLFLTHTVDIVSVPRRGDGLLELLVLSDSHSYGSGNSCKRTVVFENEEHASNQDDYEQRQNDNDHHPTTNLAQKLSERSETVLSTIPADAGERTILVSLLPIRIHTVRRTIGAGETGRHVCFILVCSFWANRAKHGSAADGTGSQRRPHRSVFSVVGRDGLDIGKVQERGAQRRRHSLPTTKRAVVAGELRTLLDDRVVQEEHDATATASAASDVASSTTVRVHKPVKLEVRSLNEDASSRASAARLCRGRRSVGRQLCMTLPQQTDLTSLATGQTLR